MGPDLAFKIPVLNAGPYPAAMPRPSVRHLVSIGAQTSHDSSNPVFPLFDCQGAAGFNRIP